MIENIEARNKEIISPISENTDPIAFLSLPDASIK